MLEQIYRLGKANLTKLEGLKTVLLIYICF